jgi:hypothetical protein
LNLEKLGNEPNSDDELEVDQVIKQQDKKAEQLPNDRMWMNLFDMYN